MMQARFKRDGELFVYLLALTAFFMFAEICFVVHYSAFYLGDAKLIASRLKIPFIIVPDILFFILSQCFVHFIFTVFVWGIARLSAIKLKFNWKQTEKWGFFLWIISIITVILANQYFFPNSKFSELMNGWVSENVLFFILVLLSIFIFSVVSISALVLFSKQKTISSFLMISAFCFWYFSNPIAVDASTRKKPNIILIGIDSLRPDFLNEENSPHLEKFLNRSITFEKAFTPLARTFPAWVSILTGEYPKQHGMRTNLQDQTTLNTENMLSVILQKKGYQTIFATDENRFSNIDKRYGFDLLVTPKMGVNDFLLGTFNDFPLSNLWVNTKIGEWLFPYSYANRAASVTYQTHSFLNKLQANLPRARQQPVFLAVHFCLPHFPYTFGEIKSKNTSLENYQSAIQAVDQQVNSFLNDLKKNKFLEHAIVVLLSDHGEAIELPGDRVTEASFYLPQQKAIPKFYPAMVETEALNQSAGHGTDVLGLSQYQVMLAFQFFGIKNPFHQQHVKNIVSLLDIKPTLLAYLKINSQGNVLFHRRRSQDFFIESDFSPSAVRSIHPEMQKVLFEGVDYFQIDPKTAHVTVKPSMQEMIYASKQFADLRGDWVLALYPQENKKQIPILINLKSNYWTDDLQSDFAKHSPAKKMLHAMTHFYSGELVDKEEG